MRVLEHYPLTLLLGREQSKVEGENLQEVLEGPLKSVGRLHRHLEFMLMHKGVLMASPNSMRILSLLVWEGWEKIVLRKEEMS